MKIINLKIAFLTYLLIILSGVVELTIAQVKIGNNPNTIDSNSLLELESTTKGFLAPRVAINDLNSFAPLTNPVPEGMLVYSSGGSVANGFYLWNGSKWLLVITSKNTRKDYVLVKSESDLPLPVGGVITLEANTAYEINGMISLTNKINLNGCTVYGQDVNNDMLVYTPASGELFTGAVGGNIRRVMLTASGVGTKLFNIIATSGGQKINIQNCMISDCDNIGLLKGLEEVILENIELENNTNGITFENDSFLIVHHMCWYSSNSNTFEKYIGKFKTIQMMGSLFYTLSASSATAIDISGITNISGVAALKIAEFIGDGTYITGAFAKQWEVECLGINTEKDDVASGNLYISSSAATTFTAVNTPTKVLGTTTAVSLFRVSSPSNNKLTYTGTRTRRFALICSLSLTSGGNNKYYSFYIYKNGVMLPESKQELKLGSGVDKGSVTLSCTLQLNPNDYIEVWVENTTDNTSVTVESLNLAIK